jgi:hypothetical protein
MTALFLSLFCFVTPLVIAVPHPAVESPQSAAVYLKPYSAVPTGHFNVEVLKSKLIKQEKIQWALVKDSTGLEGWTPLQNLLTPLHFSSKAQIMAQSPLYRTSQDSRPDPTLKVQQEETVQILEIQNSWAKIVLGNLKLWTHTRFLYPIDKDPGYFFAKKDVVLRAQSQTKSQHLTRISAGSQLRPLEILKPWAKVRFGESVGYVPLDDMVTRIDVAHKIKTEDGFKNASRADLGAKIYAIFINPLWLGSGVQPIPLFEFPSASSPLVGRVSSWKNLTQQDLVEQDWALSRVPQLGEVWWSIPQDRTIFRKLVRLPSEYIREMKENPIFSHVKIASARGLFRSSDGVLWTPLRGFEGSNPVFTYAADGVLFVDDKISFDNGEHFSPYIFWENLLRTLKNHQVGVRNQIKILSIQTLNNTSQQIVLRLDLGGGRPASLYSINRGRDWQYLQR